MQEYIAIALAALFKIWANHAGKPPDWKPTQQEIDDMLVTVDSATPEARKAAARARLGMPPE